MAIAYLYLEYGLDGKCLCYEIYQNEEDVSKSNSLSSGKNCFITPTGIELLADSLVEKSRQYEGQFGGLLTLVWEVPPGLKDNIYTNNFTIKRPIDEEDIPKIAEALKQAYSKNK